MKTGKKKSHILKFNVGVKISYDEINVGKFPRNLSSLERKKMHEN